MALLRYGQMMYVESLADLPAAADDGQMAFLLDTQSTVTFSVTTKSWTPLGRQMVFRSTKTVNARDLTSIAIATLPKSKLLFYPTGIITRAVEIAGSGTAPAITIGTNGPAYNNIASGNMITAALGSLDIVNGAPSMATFSPGLAGESVIHAKVTTAALLYTKYTIKFDLLGFYDSAAP